MARRCAWAGRIALHTDSTRRTRFLLNVCMAVFSRQKEIITFHWVWCGPVNFRSILLLWL
jgi:hypothetical protein